MSPILTACRLSVTVVLLSFTPALIADDKLPTSGDTKADHYHDTISNSVTAAASWLDSFFDDESYQDEENKSRLRLSLSSFSEQGEGTDFKGKVSLRVRLPQLENRLQLIISGNSGDFDTTDSDQEDIEDEFTGDDEDNLTVGLRYYLKQARRQNASISGGVRFRSGKPIVFIQPRYRYLKNLTNWDLRFIQKIGWYSDSGVESNTELKLERLLAEDLFFRTSAQLDWYEDEAGVYPQLRFVLRKPLSKNRVLSLQWNNYFETKPDAVLDSSVLKLRYRQQLWRKWLWLEAAPQIAFPRDEDYDATPGILLKLQVYFQKD